MELEAHILIVEYPGYGIYEWMSPSEKVIYEDAIEVYHFLIDDLDLKPD